MKKRAMTSENARRVRQQGHDDALEFAKLIGLSTDYKNDLQAKKDVIDLSGDGHSVKSSKKKWQIFLYSASRFDKDIIFKRLNGLGQLLLDCINVFPKEYEDYKNNKKFFKEKLKEPMIKLKEKLANVDTLEAFLNKSLFNAGEVNYLTIKDTNVFYIFRNNDVLNGLRKCIKVENSRARREGQMSAQKVVFKYEGTTIGEIEMRNDSKVHNREIKFWLDKIKTIKLLKNNIQEVIKLKDNLFVYGKAIKTFKKY